ncbi:MAG: hypothetical protein OEX22_05590 [Cyclobacteriaceae bacterium]|nr:hypothetical protein [Cyclobacteriaceae bacterium]
MRSQNQIKSVRIINDKFNPIDAKGVISCLIGEQVNFCKIQHLSHWERNHTIDGELIDIKVADLYDKKNELEKIIIQAKEGKLDVHISGTLEIKLLNRVDDENEKIIDLVEVDQISNN